MSASDNYTYDRPEGDWNILHGTTTLAAPAASV